MLTVLDLIYVEPRFTLRTDHKVVGVVASCLRTRRVCCPDGCILRNNSSSPLYTGRERTMEMLMDFHALHRRRVGSAHAVRFGLDGQLGGCRFGTGAVR